MPVKLVGLVGDRRHDDAAVFGHCYRGFAAKLVFLVLFAFSDAADTGLMEGVDLVLVSGLLLQHPTIEFECLQIGIPNLIWEFFSSSRINAPVIVRSRLCPFRASFRFSLVFRQRWAIR